jgi:hypothetical protein
MSFLSCGCSLEVSFDVSLNSWMSFVSLTAVDPWGFGLDPVNTKLRSFLRAIARTLKRLHLLIWSRIRVLQIGTLHGYMSGICMWMYWRMLAVDLSTVHI